MTYFHQQGNVFFASATHDSTIPPTRLPLGTYSLKISMQGFYLEKVDDIEVSGKVYGDIVDRADRVIETFFDRPNGTGVLLQGDKGSGKTMLAKILSMKLREDHDTITIIVNTPFSGEAFNTFMMSIDQPTMVFCDEFEKVYDKKEDQSALLTLFDGVYPSKKLFVLTINDSLGISSMMKNRPGRLFYSMVYKGLEDRFIREYSLDNLKKELHPEIDRILMFSQMFSSFNFDMLKGLIEEMNRYNEGVAKASKFLNIRPEVGGGMTYYVKELKAFDKTFTVDTDQQRFDELYYLGADDTSPGAAKTKLARSPRPKTRRPSREDGLNTAVNGGQPVVPLSNNVMVYYYQVIDGKLAAGDGYDDEWQETQFTPENIFKMTKNEIHYKNDQFTLVIAQRQNKSFDPYSYLGE